MNKNIKDIAFFIETNPLFQRGDNKVFDLLIREIQENEGKDLDLDLEVLLDKIEVEGFICDLNDKTPEETLTKQQAETTKSEILETYFLEKNRYERYYSTAFKKIEDLESRISSILKLDEGISIKELSNKIIDDLFIQREIINESAKGRDRFSFLKYNREIISRAKKIAATLILNEIVLTDEVTLLGVLGRVAKEVMATYNSDIEDISVIGVQEQIELVGEKIKNYAVIFDKIKRGVDEDSEDFIELLNNNDLNDIKRLPSLRGAMNPGMDFEQRIVSNFTELIMGEEKIRKRTRRLTRVQKENMMKELSTDTLFKNKLREIITSILKVSGVEVNSSTTSLFLDAHNIQGDFALPIELLGSFLNITVKTNNNNLDIFSVIGNLNNIEGKDVLSVVNNRPQKELKKINRIIKKENEGSKLYIEASSRREEIDKVRGDFLNFKEEYGEHITSLIEDEFLKIFNYSIHIQRVVEKMNKSPEMQFKLREEYSYESSDILFKDVTEINDFIGLLMFLKKNNKILDNAINVPKFEMEQIKKAFGNFGMESFRDLENGTIEYLMENQESIIVKVGDYKEDKDKKKKKNNI